MSSVVIPQSDLDAIRKWARLQPRGVVQKLAERCQIDRRRMGRILSGKQAAVRQSDLGLLARLAEECRHKMETGMPLGLPALLIDPEGLRRAATEHSLRGRFDSALRDAQLSFLGGLREGLDCGVRHLPTYLYMLLRYASNEAISDHVARIVLPAVGKTPGKSIRCDDGDRALTLGAVARILNEGGECAIACDVIEQVSENLKKCIDSTRLMELVSVLRNFAFAKLWAKKDPEIALNIANYARTLAPTDRRNIMAVDTVKADIYLSTGRYALALDQVEEDYSETRSILQTGAVPQDWEYAIPTALAAFVQGAWARRLLPAQCYSDRDLNEDMRLLMSFQSSLESPARLTRIRDERAISQAPPEIRGCLDKFAKPDLRRDQEQPLLELLTRMR